MREIIARYKKTFVVILVLVAVSPVFGVILADILDYHEPLDIVAELLDLDEITEEINWTPFLDYSVPGLSPEAGYIVSGLVGAFLVFFLGYLVVRLRK